VTSAGRRPIERRPDQLLTATALGDDGCLVRIAGTSVERVWRAIRDMLDFVPPLLRDNPWNRKW
jgi:hypothetical protein